VAQLELNSVSTRETAGASTTSRFRFQANFAMLCACDLHQQGGNYAVIVEHFEDITLYEPDNDKPLTFVQVKGKMSGSWTVGELTRSIKDKPPPNSIVAKLYENVANFRQSTAGIQFVSNAVFNVKLADGKKSPADASEIPASALHATELTKIANALEAEHPAPRIPDCKDILTLKRVQLDVKDQETFVIGRLVKLADSLGISGIAHSALYRTLHSDISAKSAEVTSSTSTDDLIRKKGVTRADFDALLTTAAQTPRFEEFRDLLKSELQNEGMNHVQILKITAACRNFIAGRSLGRAAENVVSERMQRIYRENRASLESCTSILQLAHELIGLFGNDEVARELLLAGALIAISETIDG
jgi:hypothetical protein